MEWEAYDIDTSDTVACFAVRKFAVRWAHARNLAVGFMQYGVRPSFQH